MCSCKSTEQAVIAADAFCSENTSSISGRTVVDWVILFDTEGVWLLINEEGNIVEFSPGDKLLYFRSVFAHFKLLLPQREAHPE